MQLFLIKAAVSPGVLEVKGYSFMTFSCALKLVLLPLWLRAFAYVEDVYWRGDPSVSIILEAVKTFQTDIYTCKYSPFFQIHKMELKRISTAKVDIKNVYYQNTIILSKQKVFFSLHGYVLLFMSNKTIH